VVGIAGIKEKCEFVTEVLGFDACVSHKSATLAEDLRTACPAGIDAYFENVGGQVFAAVLPLLNPHARISLCGLVSQYSTASSGDPHDTWMAQGTPVFERQHVEVHRLHVRDFVPEHQAHFFEQMANWIREGKVKYKEDLWPGLEQAPEAFRAMLEGGNFGKTLVGVGEDPTLDAALKARRAGANVLLG
jgi:NADPH-dependent curcumin reductase CurA